jgi:hypothetical protein
MREVYRKTKKKLILYLVNGQTATYYSGATHPTRDANGKMVMLNKKMIDMLIPLLKAQECFEDVRVWKNEKVHVDLNKIRETNVGMPSFCISRWYFYVWPEMACDLTEQWLTVPDTDKDFAKGKILISRTERYLNPNELSYKFLKPYQKDILFIGTELEHAIFVNRFKLKKIKRLIVKDFLELAQAIKQSKFHMSNQTMAFQISQGLKHPRMVELYELAPNVIPIGKNAYDFFSQTGLEYHFHTLNNTLSDWFEKQGIKIEKPVETGL